MKLRYMLLSVPFVLLHTSCNHKDLAYEGSADLAVSFDWSRCADASPEVMRLAVFKEGTHQLDIPFAPTGGTTTLTTGVYGFIAYNSESEVLTTSGTAYDTFEICSRPTSLARFSQMFAARRVPRAAGTEEQDYVYCPDELWTSALQQTVSAGTHLVSFPMQPATVEYVFVINNVQNLSTVREVTATLSGMSGSWIPTLGRCSDTHCIMPFDVVTDGQSTITARVRCFGHCPGDGHSDHMLMVYAMLSDQTKWYYTFDVTEALHDANHHNEEGDGDAPEVPIILDDLPLPQPVPAEGMGLSPQVDTWQEVTIEQKM